MTAISLPNESLELSRVINFAGGVASAEYSISLVKSILEWDIKHNADHLKKLQDFYDAKVTKYGERAHSQ